MLSNYGYGLSDNSPGTPWNEEVVPDQDFDLTCVQTLSKSTVVTTNDYTPGASGCDAEPDGEGGYTTVGWQDPDDTSDTCWSDVYRDNEHYTPLELINLLKVKLEAELKEIENTPVDNKHPYMKQMQVRKLKHLIEECDDWNEDEVEFIND